MAFDDPLQWVILGAFVVVVLVVIVYVLRKILGTLSKTDKYFDSKEKGLEQPKQASTNPIPSPPKLTVEIRLTGLHIGRISTILRVSQAESLPKFAPK